MDMREDAVALRNEGGDGPRAFLQVLAYTPSFRDAKK